MKALIFLLLVGTVAYGIVVISEPVPFPPQDEGITAYITADSTVSQDNIESAKYTIRIRNPANATIFFTIPINFNYKPESVSLERNGKPVELAVETEAKRGFSRYSEKIGMEPYENVTYVLTYKTLLLPGEYGIWALRYSYSPPVSFFEARSGSAYIPVRPRYSGDIRFGYKTDSVSCSGCFQKDGAIKIDNMEYFGLSWEKRRTPYRAGILYLLLLGGIAVSIARARRTPIAGKKKR